MRQSSAFPGCSQILYIKKNHTILSLMPLSFFIEESPSATQGALLQRRLYVGVSCAFYARLETVENNIQLVKVLY